jgi:gamma-glutamyltranspeptidase / glutathione hydrolase
MRRALALTLAALLLAPAGFAASKDPQRGRSGMVASTRPVASQIGADVMKRGGNAVDAAVAVAFALAVTWPSAGNLGGGGFMLIRTADGKAEAIDYRERAPLAASRGMYLDASGRPVEGLSTVGGKASAVPGTVAGLWLAHQRHGKLPWRDLVEPARRLAAEGFVVDHYLARSLAAEENAKRLGAFAESRRIFLRDGRHWREGETLRQPELAKTLGRIAEKGPDDFYRGETARLLVAELRAEGGIVTMRDLAEYEPVIRKPLRGTYRGLDVISMPPPSSGGIALVGMLNMLESFDIALMGHNSSASVHVLAEVMRRAFADRARFLGDADFVEVPVDALTSKEYAAKRMESFDARRITEGEAGGAGDPFALEPVETTHFTVVDAEGNAVSNTYTLNDSYGSGVTVRGAGFLLNNEMDDFTTAPGVPNMYGLVQGEANSIEPRKRPLSSMTPAFVVRDGELWLALGSPGGPRIITAVLQVIVNVADHGMNLQEAIDAPRIHHQWSPDEIYWEKFGVSIDVRSALEARGHRFRAKPVALGDVQGVMIESPGGIRLGASDPRLGGAPAGY